MFIIHAATDAESPNANDFADLARAVHTNAKFIPVCE